ncbi:MAG: hypothetical protein B6244_04855 [Candidatus Cloacimonetes bacterium 4572_55]|nr:MAG: hypothetical protein B6244_04855 [Candidatus Cloacimonetes bacterium 4572_55]
MAPNPLPEVYCIILNWNGRQLLCETVNSVQKMTYPNFEIVVVDNGSEDGSEETIEADYPDVTLVKNETNLGFGEGNNVGMQYALDHNVEWIFLLNNDIEVHPNLLSELIQAALPVEKIGALGPKIYFFEKPETFWFAGGQINFWTGSISHRGLRKKDHGQYNEISETDYITGCALLIHASALKEVGLFDPIYSPAYSEDADLCQRLRLAGYKLIYVPSAQVWHKVSSSSGGGMTSFKTQLKVEHNLIFFKRYAHWYQWPSIVVSIGTMTIFFLFQQLIKGNFKIINALFKGFWKALRRLFHPHRAR